MSHAFSDSKPGPIRIFGNFELRRLLARSASTMLWLVQDRREERELLLTLPRTAPAAQGVAWLERVRHAARLDHPNLARVVETGVVDGWPYVAVERASTLGEWLALHPQPAPTVVAGWLCAALQGLAFAHEAGIAHLDVQLHKLLIDEKGRVAVMALGAGEADDEATALPSTAHQPAARAAASAHTELQRHRAAAERDVLACGVLLQRLLAGRAPDDDVAAVIAGLPPQGRESLRLPWTPPLPVDAALRAIADRSTAAAPRLRYRNARTLLGALQGWRDAERDADGGAVALLLERLQNVGHLPALPGVALRVAKLTGIESRRTDEIARGILPDLALAFELMRSLNSVEMQATQIASGGPVLTLRRVVALIGVDGVRRAANTLRPWPGALEGPAAAALQQTMQRVRLAGHLAQALRPAGYDAEVVYLIAMLQNLGRLMLGYHFAEEAAQIEQLVQQEDGAEVLSERAAAQAVLGVDIDLLGLAVARHWGLADEVQQMMHRVPPDVPVRRPDRDIDVLRLSASAANETVDAVSRLAPQRLAAALAQVAQRYARVLGINPRSLEEALDWARAQAAREAASDAAVAKVPETSQAP